MVEKRGEKRALLVCEAKVWRGSFRRGLVGRSWRGCRHGYSPWRHPRLFRFHGGIARHVPLALLVHQERLARDGCRAANAAQLGEVDLEAAALCLRLALVLGVALLDDHLLQVAGQLLLLEGMTELPVDTHLTVNRAKEAREVAAALGGGVGKPLRPAAKAKAHHLARAYPNGALWTLPAVVERDARKRRERPRRAIAHEAIDPAGLPAAIAVDCHAARNSRSHGSNGLPVRANERRAKDVHGRDVPHGDQHLIVRWRGYLLPRLLLQQATGEKLRPLHGSQGFDPRAKQAL